MVTEVFSGSEMLSDNWFWGIMAVMFRENSKITKLEWCPKNKKKTSEVEGVVNVSSLSSVGSFQKLGKTKRSISSITSMAKSRWGEKKYNTGGKNCIAFAKDVCNQLGLQFDNYFLRM